MGLDLGTLPDPGQAGTVDDLVERLRLLKVWAGDPSFEWITGRVNAAWAAAGRPPGELVGKTTVVDCFRPGRRRLNIDLVVAVAAALHPDVGYATQWRQALRVIAGRSQAAGQVRVQDGLPSDLTGFTGRAAELDLLHRAAHRGGGGSAVLVITGMAGVGKSKLAIHFGHRLTREQSFDRVLFVNLRGFHPDPGQPPADPAAVLDGFLRLLGVPGQQIPHELTARTSVYRARLAGTRALVVLDNAADADQVRPLLPETPGCLVLVTSRRRLADLSTATHLAVEVFTSAEAEEFLSKTVTRVPAGTDPVAVHRIAGRCGHLPLALALVSAHIRDTPGWTLTDHADRLDERHRQRRLDTGIELALDLSYRQLPGDRQRLLRLLALHPGQEVDVYAAAALAGTGLSPAANMLRQLSRDHLLEPAAPGRYRFHDLVRAYAADRAGDEDPPPHRRVALTRLFDFYLATAARAADTAFPAEAHRRPPISRPGTPMPALADPVAARAWFDAERATLIAVAAHTAGEGWPAHTTRLAMMLARYLASGHFADALTVHDHARHAARHSGDTVGYARALTNLGIVTMQMGRYQQATEHLRSAMLLLQECQDVWQRETGRYVGDRIAEARALDALGMVERRLGHHEQAAAHLHLALSRYRRAGDRTGEACVLVNLGDVESEQAISPDAADHFQQALELFRQTGDESGQAWALEGLGRVQTLLGQPDQAAGYYERALVVFRVTGERDGEVNALNGIGEATHAVGHPADALGHHAAALAIATETGDGHQEARAHAGLGRAYGALGNTGSAICHYQRALARYTELGTPEAEEIRARLAVL